jgi:glucose-1-phosphate cytidylyltransferase
MKVVLFCGGYGMRLREFSEAIPKPMVNIGYRPILWHVMKYYAHFGHKDFILCLGWKGDVIKEYFLRYDECVSNDFVLSAGGRQVDLISSDIDDWTVTFVDTGTASSIGQRLLAVERHLDGEETFLANYTDGLTDLPLPQLIDFYREQQAAAAFVAVRPNQSFHTVAFAADGSVRKIEAVGQSDVWMNGGNFVLSREIFSHMRHGEELVNEPFQRLIAERRLAAFKYEGFWSCMDTFKEKQHLDEMYARGEARWELWKQPAPEEELQAAPPLETAAPIDETLLKAPRRTGRLRAAK